MHAPPPNAPTDAQPPELPPSPKLRRAVELFREYDQAAKEWVERGEGVVQTYPVPGALSLEFPPAPEHISLLIGDCLQDLRAALDHEVFQLASAIKGRLWSGLRECQFPIYDSEKNFEQWRTRRIGALSAPVQELIRTLQVWVLPADPAAKPLQTLNNLARVDRHRLLHLAAAQPTSIAVGPVMRGAMGVPGQMSLRMRFVDPDFLGVDTHLAITGGIAAVAWTIERIREAA
jgi:hypothetical protein